MTDKPPDDASASTDPSEPLPTCRCGHDRDHYMVTAECKYTGWGWFWVALVGASANPVKVVYRCRRCRQVLEETTDPAVLKRHM